MSNPVSDPIDPSGAAVQADLDAVARGFRRVAPAAVRWILRLVADADEVLRVRRDVLDPPLRGEDRGAYIEITVPGGQAYGATCDLSPAGLGRAARQALDQARALSARALSAPPSSPGTPACGHYRSPVAEPWEDLSLEERITLVRDACRALDRTSGIVDREAVLVLRHRETLTVTSDGGEHRQSLRLVRPALRVTASAGGQTQRRTGGGADQPRQGGREVLAAVGFPGDAEHLVEEAVALVHAPECPRDVRDLVLDPGQMALQIHESIGHPLELDRILGDERNYAGSSFVTLDMFGRYRYGSELLNVTFAPDVAGEIASCARDDEGTPATREHLIRDGVLVRPLGGASSQLRAGLPGTGATRACDWRRPPIDRMANLNLEPGAGSLEDLIAGVERGVYMRTNRSWSIDDRRNKFQFGCEMGELIADGERRGLVRNPGYRGLSTAFWRSLSGVAGAASVRVHGVSNCGKGEPNQSVLVGHASPPCRFREVEIFGGSG